MNALKIGDAWLHVEAALQPQRNVVYVNSLGSDLRIWDGVVQRLAARGWGALRYDLRGHGLSDLANPPRLIADHARDLAHLMAAVGLERACICGVSVGGAIALGLAQAHPERVERLVLCNTGAKIGTTDSWNARIAAVEADGVASVAEEVLKRWFPPQADPGLVALARNMLSRTTAAGYISTCVALRDSDLTEAARGVTVPTLCVAGELDGSTPPGMVRALQGLIEGADYFEIPGAGHLPCWQMPATLAERLAAILG